MTRKEFFEQSVHRKIRFFGDFSKNSTVGIEIVRDVFAEIFRIFADIKQSVIIAHAPRLMNVKI